MDENMLLNEKYGLIATIDPAVNTSAYTDYIDMAKFDEVCAIAMYGNMGAYTIDFAAYGYTDQSASNETAIKAITQLANSATTNDNDQSIIHVRNEDVLAKASTYALRYVRFKLTSGSQDGPSAVVVLGKPKQGLGTAHNLASVTEVENDLS